MTIIYTGLIVFLLIIIDALTFKRHFKVPVPLQFILLCVRLCTLADHLW